MDFGLGKYLEMFEERFGKKAATRLLVLITIALVSICLRLVYSNILAPVYHAVAYVTGDQSLYEFISGKIVSAGISVFLIVLIGSAINHLLTRFFQNRVEAVLQKAEQYNKDIAVTAKDMGRILEKAAMLTAELDARAIVIAEAEKRLGIKHEKALTS